MVLIRGGGDLASGVALRLRRCGINVLISELPQPLAVRRLVSFAEAVYRGEMSVEGVTACRIADPNNATLVVDAMTEGRIPVIIDPNGDAIRILRPNVIVDARMLKHHVEYDLGCVELLIGLGPGFVVGDNCHAVIETNRGISMGRVNWEGSAEKDTSLPEAVAERQAERVLRSPAEGELKAYAHIGDHLEPGGLIAEVSGRPVIAPFKGVLRGLIRPGLNVRKNLKIGDLDPRNNSSVCIHVSDKSLAVGGGVLEAILSRPELRSRLWA